MNLNNVNYEIEFENEDKYIGKLNKDNKMEGLGKYFYSNGNYYEGNFENNEFCGKGILNLNYNKIKIEGFFINSNLDFNKNHKVIKSILKNEIEIYEGKLDNLYQKVGYGNLKNWKDNKLVFKYKGNFLYDNFNDYGEYSDNILNYKGNFLMGKFNDKGEIQMNNSKYDFYLKSEFNNNKISNNFEGKFVDKIENLNITFKGIKDENIINNNFKELNIFIGNIEINYIFENNKLLFLLKDNLEKVEMKGEIDNNKIIDFETIFNKDKIEFKSKSLNNELENSTLIVKILSFLSNEYYIGSYVDNFKFINNNGNN